MSALSHTNTVHAFPKYKSTCSNRSGHNTCSAPNTLSRGGGNPDWNRGFIYLIHSCTDEKWSSRSSLNYCLPCAWLSCLYMYNTWLDVKKTVKRQMWGPVLHIKPPCNFNQYFFSSTSPTDKIKYLVHMLLSFTIRPVMTIPLWSMMMKWSISQCQMLYWVRQILTSSSSLQ